MAASKINEYIEQRLLGLTPKDAARAVGYSPTAIAVTVSKLEARADVKKALGSGKTKHKPLAKPGVGKTRAQQARDNDPDGVAGMQARLNPWKLRDRYDSPLDLMLDVVNNAEAPAGLRIECAKTALPYCHPRKEGGVKDAKVKGAKEVASGTGRMSSMPAPTKKNVVPIRKAA